MYGALLWNYLATEIRLTLCFLFRTNPSGELKLASQMQAEESEASNPKLKKFRQKKREVQCAVNLVQKVQPFIDLNGDEEVRVQRFVLCVFLLGCVSWFLL